MEEQNKPSTSSTSTEGGGRGDGDNVEEVVDNNKQQLRNERERERRRLNQDLLALSNDHISQRLRPRGLGSSVLKVTTSTSSSSSQGRSGGGAVSKQRKRRSAVVPSNVVDGDDNDEEKRMKMARLAQAVFSNSLITSRILPHLNFSDLKAARQVSSDFFDNIKSFGGFKNSAVLIVSKDSVEVAGFCLFDKDSSMTQTWHGIQIEVDLPLDVLDKIRHILENVQFVSFVTGKRSFRQESWAKFIAGVLRSTPKLKALQMDVNFWRGDLTRQVWSCPIIRHHLKNLESLEICDFLRESQIKVYGTWDNQIHFIAVNYNISVGNIQQLEALEMPRLKSLRFTKYVKELSTRSAFTRSFLNLLRKHSNSLVEVSIPVDAWIFSDDIHPDIRSVTLPQLKSLTALVSYKASGAAFETFLINHPHLEELDVQFSEREYGRQNCLNLWEAFKRRICSSAARSYLKKLHLKTKNNFWVFCAERRVLVVDWSFLGEMTALKDFQVESSFISESLETWGGSLGAGWQFLKWLPRNQLERLSLNGMHFQGSFWKFRSEGKERLGPQRYFIAPHEEVPLATKFELLRGFRNLKRLSFRHSPNALDDDVIQFIFREMTALEELEVSHCSRLTDVGLAGTGPEEEERVSLQRLKDLKLLSIRSCPAVTPEGLLLSVLGLPSLQHFDYFTASPVSKSFVWGIAGQNPSLETISVHTTSGNSDRDTDIWAWWSSEEKKAFLKEHPRITALHNLAILKQKHEYAAATDRN